MGHQPHIGIIHSFDTPEEILADFRQAIAAGDLIVRVEQEDRRGFAGVEEWMPTLIVVYILKPYFTTFLQEAAKDHYSLLKQGLASLSARLLGRDGPSVTICGTAGKIRAKPQHSMLFSVYAQVNETRTLKLLLREGQSGDGYAKVIAAFLDYSQRCHEGLLTERELVELGRARTSGATVLVVFNPKDQRIEPYDPMQQRSD